jgi:hypothetical protein
VDLMSCSPQIGDVSGKSQETTASVWRGKFGGRRLLHAAVVVCPLPTNTVGWLFAADVWDMAICGQRDNGLNNDGKMADLFRQD